MAVPLTWWSVFIFHFFFFCIQASTSALPAEQTLVKVFIGCRHGARAPTYETFKNDSFLKNDTRYWPAGAGELTKVGEREAFELGQKLRARYHDFLGDYFKGSEFVAYSTIKSRTLMSAQLVTTALFPPVGYQQWSSDLNWQPIPVYPDYIINKSDETNCPWLVINSHPEMAMIPASYFGFDEEDIAILEDQVGPYDKDSFTFMSKMWDVFDTLYFHAKEGLPLPNWTKNIFPHDKLSGAILKYIKMMLSGTPKRKETLVAPYAFGLAKFFTESDYKMEVHMWHDVNLISLMTTLGVEMEKYPQTTSAVAIELHNTSGHHYFQVYYYPSSKADEPTLLKMPCDNANSCSFMEVVKLFETSAQALKDYDKTCSSKA